MLVCYLGNEVLRLGGTHRHVNEHIHLEAEEGDLFGFFEEEARDLVVEIDDGFVSGEVEDSERPVESSVLTKFEWKHLECQLG